ncbi:MAG: hypothetical protein A2X56_07790 [Nitrospirae bacterium GWC2_57_13]|nr:MAG: hypothetical protein A2X56_07790 [Nitrospirae bacterium GWC2_57_13]
MKQNFPFTYENEDPGQRLRQLESFMSSLLDGIGEGVIVVDRNFAIRSVNTGFCKQVGLTGEDIIGKKCHAVSHHSNVPCHELGNGCDCSVHKCFDNGQHHRALHKHYDKDGRPLYIETNAYPLTDTSGAVSSAIETLHDVTATIMLQDQFREVQERYRRLYENAPDMMHSVDANGVIVVCNETEERILGFAPGELAGRPLTDIVAPEDNDKCAQKLTQLKSDDSFEGEMTLLARHGKRIPVYVSSRSIRDDQGNFVMSDTILRDITEKKQLEAQLLHSQKMEAIGLLAGGVAHDFNNILTAIIGYGNLALMKQNVDADTRQYIDQILESADRAAHLTHSLLAFSRKQIINPRPLKLGDVISRMHNLLSRIIGEDIELRIYPHDEEFPVLADPTQLEQVLMNLATNARDAMPDGGLLLIEIQPVELTEEYVRTHAFAKPGRYMLLSVTDTGHGMEEYLKEKIFEPFFSTKDIGKGTGLGLSMVYGIVKQHNGYINVYSEPGKGTTFKIYLPLIEGELAPPELRPPVEVVGGTETILLAEDDPAVRNLAATLLRAQGYKVIIAEDGEEAVARFRENQKAISLVVLDVVMPKKSGKTAYDEINLIRPGQKALFVSGYTSNLIHKKGILEEGREFISKPFTPSSFLQKVRAVLDD